jgi:Rod binding domain-containing protein
MQVHSTGQGMTGQAIQSAAQPRLVEAAHEFEGQMLKELLKPITSTGLSDEDDDAFSSSSGEVLGEFASEALGKALSEQGGFGIANRIVRQLSVSGNNSGATAVTGNLHFDTGMRKHK